MRGKETTVKTAMIFSAICGWNANVSAQAKGAEEVAAVTGEQLFLQGSPSSRLEGPEGYQKQRHWVTADMREGAR